MPSYQKQQLKAGAEMLNTDVDHECCVIFRLVLLVLLLLASAASGHVPLLPDGNDNISSAEYIADPEKSWAVYSDLSQGEAEYYSFDIQKGDRIYLSLLSTADPIEIGFEPNMALLGPGLGAEGDLPDHVKLPEGYGFIAVQGNRAKNATYEPFGPSSYYQQAELDISAPESGRYYAVVYDNQSGGYNSSSSDRSGYSGYSGYSGNSGHYSLAVGYVEEYSFTERIITPLMLISVYLWEGQRLITIITPWLVAVLLGAFAILRAPRRTPFFSTGTMAGFLFLGTSASVLTQTIFNLTRAPAGSEVWISLFLALIPAVLGVAAVRLARGEAGIIQRSLMAVIGTIGLLAGSGFIIGPLLAIMASVLPSRRGKSGTTDRQITSF